jgi:hypothetical protein
MLITLLLLLLTMFKVPILIKLLLRLCPLLLLLQTLLPFPLLLLNNLGVCNHGIVLCLDSTKVFDRGMIIRENRLISLTNASLKSMQ